MVWWVVGWLFGRAFSLTVLSCSEVDEVIVDFCQCQNMHQQRVDMDEKIEDLWKKTGKIGLLVDFIRSFYQFQSQNNLPFQECLETFRMKRKRDEDSEDSEKDSQSFVDYPLSMNTINLLLQTIHNSIAGVSPTGLQQLWKTVLESDRGPIDDKANDSSDDNDDDVNEPRYEMVTRFKPGSLNYDQLELIRSLLSASRRKTIKLKKITLGNVFLNIEEAEQ